MPGLKEGTELGFPPRTPTQDCLMPKFTFFLPKHVVSTARKGSGCYFFHASNLGFLLSSLNFLSVHGSAMRDEGGTLSPTGGVLLKHRATKLTFQRQDLGQSPTLACTRSLLQAQVLPFSKSLATTPSPPHTPRASLILTHPDTPWQWSRSCTSLCSPP